MDQALHPLAARRPKRALSGIITVPGDKSISHRALMFAALAVGQTRITGLLEGEDVLRTAAAMRALGAEVVKTGEGAWVVAGRGVGGLREPEDVLDMGNSGTAARLLCGVLATHDLFAVMTGDASLRRRPMRRVTEPLAASGAQFWTRDGGKLPLAIRGAREPLPLEYMLPVASAQVKSALLLAGLNAPGWTVVEERQATRDHTERMLRHFGADVVIEEKGAGRVVRLLGQPELMAADIVVPGDPSSAAFPLAAAAIVPGSSVTVRGVALNPARTGLLTTLQEMGASVTVTNARIEGGEDVGDVTLDYAGLCGIEVPAERAPSMIDEYPVLAAVAATAEGVTRMHGLGELRVKESDRLAATAALLTVNGVRVAIEGETLIVHGGRVPGGGLVATQMDHRLAMSALVLGQGAEDDVRVDDSSFIATSFPGFVALMRGVGAAIG